MQFEEFLEVFKNKIMHLSVKNNLELAESTEVLLSLGLIMSESYFDNICDLAKKYNITGIREYELLEAINTVSLSDTHEIIIITKDNKTYKRKPIDVHKYFTDKNLPDLEHFLFISFLMNPERMEIFQLTNILLR